MKGNAGKHGAPPTHRAIFQERVCRDGKSFGKIGQPMSAPRHDKVGLAVRERHIS
jgi:hypothetical protein